MPYDFMKEDWDTKILKESREEVFQNRESNPFRNSKYFFGFDISSISSKPYSKREVKKNNGKKIYYYG